MQLVLQLISVVARWKRRCEHGSNSLARYPACFLAISCCARMRCKRTRKRMIKAISRRAALILCASIVFSGAARADNYPAHPVKIVGPSPAGGSNDIIARILAQKLSERTGQQFVVENRGGAGGNIGAEAVAKSAPDGYTLLVTAPPPLSTNIALYKSLPFD